MVFRPPSRSGRREVSIVLCLVANLARRYLLVRLSEVLEVDVVRLSEVLEVDVVRLSEVLEVDAVRLSEVLEADAVRLSEVLEADAASPPPTVSPLLRPSSPRVGYM